MRLKSGFTLVELAIVIVVIGLLVGGVLAGQELIEAAKRTKTIREINDFKVSIYTFKLKFNQFPGDFSKAQNIWPECVDEIGNICNGDNSGELSGDNSREELRSWQHLSLAGLIKGNYLGLLNGDEFGFFPGINHPITPFGNKTFYNYYNYRYDPLVGISLSNLAPDGDGNSEVMDPKDVYSIDLKYDDSKPSSGLVILQGFCRDSEDYDVNYNGKCSFFYSIK